MPGIQQYLQVDAATLGALKYAGTWNASTNTPTLTSGVGVQGQYYVVSVSGSTNLDGETAWQVGDWAVFNGSVWQKVDGGSTGLLTTLTVTGNAYLATTSGNVGVGTTSPTAIYGKTLQISSGSTEGSLSIVGPTGAVFLATVGATGQLIARGSSALVLGSNDTERMRITSAGDVGIGTTSPISKFTVVQSADGFDQGIAIGRTGADRGTIFLNASNNTLNFGRSTSTYLTLDSAGNVGIGTSSPGSKLDIADSSANSFKAINVTATGGDAGIRLAPLSGAIYRLQASSTGLIAYNETAGATRMTLDASGNLGLGVTPSAWSGYKPLQAGTGAAFGGYAGDVLSFVSSNAYNDNTNWRYIVSGNLAARYQQSAGVHAWYTAPSGTAGNAISFTQAMTLDASGNLLVGKTSASVGTDGAQFLTTGYSAFGASGTTALFLNRNTSDGTILEFGRNGVSTATMGLTSSALTFGTAGTERMRLDASGNLGLGVAPSAWGANYKAIDTNPNAAFVIATQSVNGVGVASNAYNDNTNWCRNTSAPFR